MDPPAYIVRCAERFLEAIEEARTLAVAGDVGGRVADTLNFASDLLDIIEGALGRPEGVSAALDPISRVRDLLRAVSGDLAPVTLHQVAPVVVFDELRSR
jgi:hypothetical protein